MNVPEGWKLVPIDPTEEMVDALLTNQLEEKRTDIELRRYFAYIYKLAVAAAPTPPQERGYTLTISSEPANPTRFKRGDRIEYDKKTGVTSSQMLVIGEDETHLHTFFTEGSSAGSYYGIAKKPENLEPLVTPPAQGVEPVAYLIDFTYAGVKRSGLFERNLIDEYREVDPDAVATPLYGCPSLERLKKAAEEVLKMLDAIGRSYPPTPKGVAVVENLRTALEGK